jgi:hypothetical protein
VTNKVQIKALHALKPLPKQTTMTSLQAVAAAAITPPEASIKPPLRLHSITNAPSLHPMCGDQQTWPRLGHASSIFTDASRAMI